MGYRCRIMTRTLRKSDSLQAFPTMLLTLLDLFNEEERGHSSQRTERDAGKGMFEATRSRNRQNDGE